MKPGKNNEATTPVDIADLNNIVAKVIGDWPRENAVMKRWDGVYICQLGEDNAVLSSKRVPTPEPIFDWMASVLALGFKLDWGNAAKDWFRSLSDPERYKLGTPEISRAYTISEAAQILGIGYSTMREKIKRREIGASKIGPKTVLILSSELEAYVKRKSERPWLVI